MFHREFALCLSLLCSKFYLLFLPEFPKIFTYYSFFILVSSLLFQTYSHLISAASHLVFKMLIYIVLPELINGHKRSAPFFTSLIFLAVSSYNRIGIAICRLEYYFNSSALNYWCIMVVASY